MSKYGERKYLHIVNEDYAVFGTFSLSPVIHAFERHKLKDHRLDDYPRPDTDQKAGVKQHQCQMLLPRKELKRQRERFSITASQAQRIRIRVRSR